MSINFKVGMKTLKIGNWPEVPRKGDFVNINDSLYRVYAVHWVDDSGLLTSIEVLLGPPAEG